MKKPIGNLAEASGIATNESGLRYFVDEDGKAHYIESIGADGTVRYGI